MAAREIVSAEAPLAAQLHQKGTSFPHNYLMNWENMETWMGLKMYTLLGTAVWPYKCTVQYLGR
jgi:hypothetical protein